MYREAKSAGVAADTDSVADTSAAAEPAEPSGRAVADAAAGDDDEDNSESASIFVKNLSFDTTEGGLEELFSTLGTVRAAKIPTKRAKRDPSKRLSMGFGFVEYATPQEAQKAIRRLQGAVLDGHSLVLKVSNKRLTEDGPSAVKRKRSAASSAPEGSSKLLVKNLAFEATKRDLQELFGAYGQLKSVRIPSKFDGGHRGFGFVEFVTQQEAANAMTALKATHLYGRHLVIEWASADKGIEGLRAKAARDLAGEGKRSRR